MNYQLTLAKRLLIGGLAFGVAVLLYSLYAKSSLTLTLSLFELSTIAFALRVVKLRESGDLARHPQAASSIVFASLTLFAIAFAVFMNLEGFKRLTGLS